MFEDIFEMERKEEDEKKEEKESDKDYMKIMAEYYQDMIDGRSALFLESIEDCRHGYILEFFEGTITLKELSDELEALNRFIKEEKIDLSNLRLIF